MSSEVRALGARGKNNAYARFQNSDSPEERRILPGSNAPHSAMNMRRHRLGARKIPQTREKRAKNNAPPLSKPRQGPACMEEGRKPAYSPL